MSLEGGDHRPGIDDLNVVHGVQPIVDHPCGPGVVEGPGGDRQGHDPNSGAVAPGRPSGVPPLQRGDDQLRAARAVDVAPADAMEGGLGGDRHDPPGPLRGAGPGDDRQVAARLRIGGTPGRAEREVDSSVAVDVVRLEADVVGFGRSSEDVALFPAWILVPDHRIIGHGDHVGLAVAVNVGRDHRVADLADLGVDHLPAPAEGGRSPRDRMNEEQQAESTTLKRSAHRLSPPDVHQQFCQSRASIPGNQPRWRMLVVATMTASSGWPQVAATPARIASASRAKGDAVLRP